MNVEQEPRQGSFWRSRTGLTLAVFLAIAAFFLVTEHTAHVFGALPFLFLLLCSLMHLFFVLIAAWDTLYKAQRAGEPATSGPYARLRHPRYVGFILIMLGFLFQWPTLVTLVMFPILMAMYVRLARREEREVLAEFGDEYARYAATTPAFFPHLGGRADARV